MKLVGKKSPFASTGLGDALQPSEGENFLGFSALFKDRGDRDADGYEIADALRDELEKVLSANYAGATIQVVPETGQPSNEAPVQIERTGSDMDTLRSISSQVQTALREQGGTTDVRDNVGSVRPEIKLIPRREAIEFHGLTQQELSGQIRHELSNNEIGKFAVSGLEDDLEIRLGVAWPSQAGGVGGPTRNEELALVRAFTPEGQSVPLLSLVRPSVSTAPLSITHQGGRRSIQVLSKTTEAVTPTEVVSGVTPVIEEPSKSWPAGYAYSFGGETAETAETFASAGVALVIAVVLIFGVLVLVLGSFAQSFILILTLPLAGVADRHVPGLLGVRHPVQLLRRGRPDLARRHRRQRLDRDGRHDERALCAAASRSAPPPPPAPPRRERPFAADHQHEPDDDHRPDPLAVSNPMWRPLCDAIIFGLLATTVMALVIVPCLYHLFTRRGMHVDADAAGEAA